jgi:alanyl-tRNA synthetase
MNKQSSDAKHWERNISADQLRAMYLDFFDTYGHAIIPSASLLPEGDAFVLFTTAGMHPLVPHFLGQTHSDGTRLIGCQKCVRTNDLE